MFKYIFILFIIIKLFNCLIIIDDNDLVKKLDKDTCCNLKDNEANYFRYLETSYYNKTNFYAGLMNHLLRINVNNMKCDSCIKEKSKQIYFNRCYIQLNKVIPECQNHFRSVIENDKDIITTTSTNSYSPLLYNNKFNSLEIINESSGIFMSPYNPLDNYTFISIHNNFNNLTLPYYSLNKDFLSEYPVIYRPKIKGTDYLEKYNHKDFNIAYLSANTQFVGSFEVDKSIYTFFREIINGETISYISKICKNEKSIISNQWLSFQKARILCSDKSIHKSFIIYSIYLENNIFYTSFYNEDLTSSIICIYDISFIEKVFNGKSIYKNSKKDFYKYGNCDIYDNNKEINTIIDENLIAFLKEDNIYSINKKVLYQNYIEITKIVVKTINNSSNIYLTTGDGELYIIFLKTFSNNEYTISSNFKILPLKEKHAIQSLKKINEYLILGTDYSLFRFDLNKCNIYKNIISCISIINCAWDCDNKVCINVYINVLKIDYTNVSLLGIKNSSFEICKNLLLQKSFTYIINNESSIKLIIQKNFIEIFNVSWFKDFEIYDNEKYIVDKNWGLNILNLDISDKGIYIAKNGDGVIIANYTILFNTPNKTTNKSINETTNKSINETTNKSISKPINCKTNNITIIIVYTIILFLLINLFIFFIFVIYIKIKFNKNIKISYLLLSPIFIFHLLIKYISLYKKKEKLLI